MYTVLKMITEIGSLPMSLGHTLGLEVISETMCMRTPENIECQQRNLLYDTLRWENLPPVLNRKLDIKLSCCIGFICRRISCGFTS